MALLWVVMNTTRTPRQRSFVGPLSLVDFTSEPYPVVMLIGLGLPSKPRRILINTHDPPGIEGREREGPVDPQSDLGSPFRMLLDLGQV